MYIYRGPQRIEIIVVEKFWRIFIFEFFSSFCAVRILRTMVTAPENSDSTPAPASAATEVPINAVEDKNKAVVPVPVVNSNLSFFLSFFIWMLSVCLYVFWLLLCNCDNTDLFHSVSFLSLIWDFDGEWFITISDVEVLELNYTLRWIMRFLFLQRVRTMHRLGIQAFVLLLFSLCLVSRYGYSLVEE